jgi:hypothetical protein
MGLRRFEMDWMYILQIVAFALVNIGFIAIGDALMEKKE